MHLWHLPAPPQGLHYSTRTFLEKDAQGRSKPEVPQGSYATTGLFPHDAPSAQGQHLAAIPVLFLDCDLCDKLAAEQPPQLRDSREKLKALKGEIKNILHSMPAADLRAHLEALAYQINGALQQLLGQPATYTISSGYGVHCYLWLLPEQWQQLPQIAQTQLLLIQQVNSLLGFEAADIAVKDAGSRVLRVPGTFNNKGAHPRPVEALAFGGGYFDLRIFSAPPTQPAAPLPALPAGSGQPLAGAAPTAPRNGEFADFDKLFATHKLDTRKALHLLFNSCPFFLWLVEHPAAVGLRSWYGAATNLAALAYEEGRSDFHNLSRLDAARYNAADCDKFYSYALAHIQGGGGPWTYRALAANGDWTGRPPAGFKAPCVLAVQRAALPDIEKIEGGLILDGKGFPRPVYTNLRRVLRADPAYGQRLRYNEMRDCVELDGAPTVDALFGDIQEAVQTRYGLAYGLAVVQQAAYETAWQHRYHPVAEYLETLDEWDQVDRIPQLLAMLQAEDLPLHRDYLRCFLIGAVRRPLCRDSAGVKMDTTLILHGRQGFKKSTFFRVLAGEWFSDSTMVPGSKDAYIAMTGNWVVEWGEFERAYSKDTDATKAFLGAQRDNFRRPYGRSEEFRVRRAVIVGTTNREHFLSDPTGDRRFHILPVRAEIQTQGLAEMRDQVWAQAVALHKAGAAHWLTQAADLTRDEANADFRIENPWQALIHKWLLTRGGGGQLLTHVTIETIMQQSIGKAQDLWTVRDTQQVGAILQTLGYQRKRVTPPGGARCYMYVQPGVDLHAIFSAEQVAAAGAQVLPFARPVAHKGG